MESFSPALPSRDWGELSVMTSKHADWTYKLLILTVILTEYCVGVGLKYIFLKPASTIRNTSVVFLSLGKTRTADTIDV